MTTPETRGTNADPFIKRLVKVIISITVLTWVTVIVGYVGGFALTITAKLGAYDPETEEGDLLRNRLLEWPDRNRDVMRTNGNAELPLKP